jgi:SAM-dependent methyltransferase
MTDRADRFFAGDELYGDDLSPGDIDKWFEAEQLGYFELAGGAKKPRYGYHALNYETLFKHIKGQRFETCLAIGCADGEEVAPLAGQIGRVIGVEPARRWWADEIAGIPATFVAPAPDGKIDLPEGSIDLITCLGVLHHIPNVSAVLTELGRVTKRDGVMLLREPNCTMGDWRRPRRGLTSNERGIPEKWLIAAAERAGFQLVRKTRYSFPLTSRIGPRLGRPDYFNHRSLVLFDRLATLATLWNMHYHRDRSWKKIAPSATAYVLRRV